MRSFGADNVFREVVVMFALRLHLGAAYAPDTKTDLMQKAVEYEERRAYAVAREG